MFLLDTNIWLERMLDRSRSEEVGQLLDNVPAAQLFLTDFSLHSIGVILDRLNQSAVFLNFIQDVFVNGGVSLVSLEPAEMERLIAVSDQYKLDFDDAYQYVAAEKYNLDLVSFDKDFDRTDRGKVTPIDIV